MFFCIVMFFGAVVGGCKSPAIVVPSVHNKDSVRIEYKYKIDSIFIDRYHTITIKGDTVIIHDSVFRNVYKYLQQHDTITVNKTDTVPVVVEVQKPENDGDRFLKNSGIAFWVLLAVLFCVGIVIIAIKIRNK